MSVRVFFFLLVFVGVRVVLVFHIDGQGGIGTQGGGMNVRGGHGRGVGGHGGGVGHDASGQIFGNTGQVGVGGGPDHSSVVGVSVHGWTTWTRRRAVQRREFDAGLEEGGCFIYYLEPALVFQTRKESTTPNDGSICCPLLLKLRVQMQSLLETAQTFVWLLGVC